MSTASHPRASRSARHVGRNDAPCTGLGGGGPFRGGGRVDANREPSTPPIPTGQLAAPRAWMSVRIRTNPREPARAVTHAGIDPPAFTDTWWITRAPPEGLAATNHRPSLRSTRTLPGASVSGSSLAVTHSYDMPPSRA